MPQSNNFIVPMGASLDKLVRNYTTGEVGIIVKHCAKTVKVLCAHPTIKGGHCFKYWSTIESI